MDWEDVVSAMSRELKEPVKASARAWCIAGLPHFELVYSIKFDIKRTSW